MFCKSSSVVCAAIPISSTYCAHLSALTTGSRYSRTKLLNAERDRVQSLGKSFVCKRSCTKVERQELDGLFVCHLEATIRLRTVKVTKVFLSSHVLCSVGYCCHRVVMFIVIMLDEVINSS